MRGKSTTQKSRRLSRRCGQRPSRRSTSRSKTMWRTGAVTSGTVGAHMAQANCIWIHRQPACGSTGDLHVDPRLEQRPSAAPVWASDSLACLRAATAKTSLRVYFAAVPVQCFAFILYRRCCPWRTPAHRIKGATSCDVMWCDVPGHAVLESRSQPAGVPRRR